MSKNAKRIRGYCLGAVFAAVITLCAWISIPVPGGVVVTLQTFAVSLCGYFLGTVAGSAALAVYILLGAAGVPVFSSFNGGMGVLAGPTGGFLYGFFALVLLCGISSRLHTAVGRTLLGCVGLLVCHLCGVLHFAAVTGSELWAAALAASVPYIIKDVLSIALAQWLSTALKKRIS